VNNDFYKIPLFNLEYFAEKSNEFRQELPPKCQFLDDTPKFLPSQKYSFFDKNFKNFSVEQSTLF